MMLRPMTSEEFDRYRERSVVRLAETGVFSGRWTEADALRESAARIARELPDGFRNTGQFLYLAEDDGVPVGLVWLSTVHPRGVPGGAWLQDIEVWPEHRGRGLGRALLAAAEEEARRLGASTLELNVFGGNTTALELYRSAGYEIVAQQLRKTVG